MLHLLIGLQAFADMYRWGIYSNYRIGSERIRECDWSKVEANA
jgi:hypothetical protein